ncbi:MAG TPA: ornithine cyclodeaminase family protein [Candidatus Dormibacteraeota bacterium]|jgi:ornithine cyclodeaminase/alanine dehydrogenase-like protein (mu-crystallin family)|nr:ornithine cyclodeaminase family protein [Candidatus Dormibacteraeota bacterium]
MTLLLSAADVESLGDMALLVRAVEQGYVEESQGLVDLPPRLNMTADVGFFRVMPVVLRGSHVMGYKAFQGSAANGVRYMIALYDERSGALLSLMDASWLTAARTGATTAVATRYMARDDARCVAVIGSGLEARTNLLAVSTVRRVEAVRVFSPRAERREAFATEMSGRLEIPVVACDSAQECVQGSDVVVVATNTGNGTGRVAFAASWLEPGMHVNSIGSTMRVLRELDERVFAAAGRVVYDSVAQVEGESGDVIAAREAGAYQGVDALALADVVAGTVSGRASDTEITLFKSVGTAVQDVMAALAVHREAVHAGVGNEVGDFLSLKAF